MMRTFLLLFLCLPVWAGREPGAQNTHESWHELAVKSYRLSALQMNDDGKWLTMRKVYPMNDDTLLIINSSMADHPVAFRTDAGKASFIGNDFLLLQGKQQAELIRLEEQTNICFQGVQQSEIMHDQKLLVLHYNEQESNSLELVDFNGLTVNAAEKVKKFYTNTGNQVFAIAETENKLHQILLLSGKEKKAVYESANLIEHLTIDHGRQGLIVYERKLADQSQEVVYLDLSRETAFPLNEALSYTFQSALTEVIRENSSYFLQLTINEKDSAATPATIWYGTDRKPEEKFYPKTRTLTYVWEPLKNKVLQLKDEQHTTHLNLGHERYFLSLKPYLLHNYSKEHAPFIACVYDRLNNRFSLLDTLSHELHPGVDHALSSTDEGWQLYHLPTGKKVAIRSNDTETPYFTSNGHSLLFDGNGGLWQYDLKREKLNEIAAFGAYQSSIVNHGWEGFSVPKGTCSRRRVNLKEPLIIRLYHPEKNLSSYVLWSEGTSEVLIPPTTRRISLFRYNKAFDRFSWIEEDYNLPPQLLYREKGQKESIMYQSNQHDRAIVTARQEIVAYNSSEGKPLQGILYYPLNYQADEKYPMVLHIYEKQRQLSNRYLQPSCYESLGFNIRLLIEKGYFVYLPDIVIQGKKGPGIDALHCVDKALDALAGKPSIDFQKVGLIGHSFGAYECNFIATHSDRFAAYVAGSGHSDLVWAGHAFNYNFMAPDYQRVESGQYQMNIAYSENPELYFKNNPLYHAAKVDAPVLLWSGTDDRNVTSDHSMAFFNALSRNEKCVAALFYQGEGHSFVNKAAQKDLTSKILDWFDYFLKGNTNVYWVNKSIP